MQNAVDLLLTYSGAVANAAGGRAGVTGGTRAELRRLLAHIGGTTLPYGSYSAQPW
jgi:hypothetical protein